MRAKVFCQMVAAHEFLITLAATKPLFSCKAEITTRCKPMPCNFHTLQHSIYTFIFRPFRTHRKWPILTDQVPLSFCWSGSPFIRAVLWKNSRLDGDAVWDCGSSRTKETIYQTGVQICHSKAQLFLEDIG